MKKILSTLTVCVVMAGVSTAQDPNFSQFFASPLTLNPALTGKFDGVYRVAGNYRDQWPTINNAFVTKTVSFDAGILKNRLPEIDHATTFHLRSRRRSIPILRHSKRQPPAFLRRP